MIEPADVTVDQVMVTASQVLAAQEKIDELKSACMFGSALIYEVVGQKMLAAKQTYQVIDNIEFHCDEYGFFSFNRIEKQKAA